MGDRTKPEIGFYHLQKWPLEKALPRLLEQALARGLRVVVRTASEERLAVLNAALWTYHPSSFLPHGGPGDGAPEEQPIYLTTAEENPNGAGVLVLTDGAEARDLDNFERCLDLFDGSDPVALDLARARWRSRKAEGYPLAYWQQTPEGRWERKP